MTYKQMYFKLYGAVGAALGALEKKNYGIAEEVMNEAIATVEDIEFIDDVEEIERGQTFQSEQDSIK